MKKILVTIGVLSSIGICTILAHAASLSSGSPVIGSGSWCRDGSGIISPCVITDTLDVQTIATSSIKLSFYNMTSDYVATVTDYSIFCNATTAAATVTLPPAADVCIDNKCGVYNIIKIDGGGNACTIDGDNSETISGLTTIDLITQYESITIQSNKSEWFMQ